MRTVVALQGQTLFDIALEYMGTAEAVFTLLELNPTLRPDRELDSGEVVSMPDDPAKPLVVAYYFANDIHPLGHIAAAQL